MPTRYREQLLENAAGQMVCTIDIHHPCLLLYPLPEWEIIEQKLSRLSSMNPVERRVQRLLLGHASECQMDGAGRLLIAPVLRQHAGLTKEVMLVGQFNKFELWMKQPGINRSRKISTQSSWLPETYRSDCRTCLYKMMENYKHTTVLLDEAVNGLNIRPDGIYIDGTFGRGGHSRLILSQLGEEGRLLAIIATRRLSPLRRLLMIRASPSSTDLSPRWANTLPSAILSARSTAFSSILASLHRNLMMLSAAFPLCAMVRWTCVWTQPVGSQPLNGYKPQKKPISPGIENLW